MFAAFQAGAWRALAGRFAPDVVIGASAGALNAWMVAGRVDPEELCRLWLTLDEQMEAPRLQWPRRWGDGIVDATGLEQLLRRVTKEHKPALGLGVTVCEGWRLRNRVYWDGEVRVEHLLASGAVPGVLSAQRLGGGLSFDGGLRGACPVWAAEEWGATEIVAIDVWTDLPWWWGLGLRRWLRRPDGARVWRIQPPGRLGRMRESAVWSRANMERWIAAGEAAAR
jgi:NTE family protein